MNERVRLHAPPDASLARFSTAEFVTMIGSGLFDDMNVELIEGELHRMPPAGNDHARRQAMLAFRLATAIGERLVRVEAGIDLGSDSLVACDVVVLRDDVGGNRMLSPDQIALAVEVAETTAARDTTLKRLAYAAADIAEYWVVDGRRAVVHAYRRPIDGDYADVGTTRFGEPLAVPGSDATITIE